MFTLCETFKWTLPHAGGLYDQDPVMLDQFSYIIAMRNKQQQKEQKKQDREKKLGGNPARPSRRRRR